MSATALLEKAQRLQEYTCRVVYLPVGALRWSPLYSCRPGSDHSCCSSKCVSFTAHTDSWDPSRELKCTSSVWLSVLLWSHRCMRGIRELSGWGLACWVLLSLCPLAGITCPALPAPFWALYANEFKQFWHWGCSEGRGERGRRNTHSYLPTAPPCLFLCGCLSLFLPTSFYLFCLSVSQNTHRHTHTYRIMQIPLNCLKLNMQTHAELSFMLKVYHVHTLELACCTIWQKIRTLKHRTFNTKDKAHNSLVSQWLLHNAKYIKD